MKCPNPACGKEIVDTAAFCSYCGTRVRPETPVAHRPEQVPAGDADAHRRASRDAALDGRSATDRSTGGMGSASGAGGQGTGSQGMGPQEKRTVKRGSNTRDKVVWDRGATLFWNNIKGFATASLVFTILLFLVPVVSIPYVGGMSMLDGLLGLFRIASIPGASSLIGASSGLSNIYGLAGVLGLFGVVMLACSIRGCRLAWSGISKGADLGIRVNGILGLIFLLMGVAAGASGMFLLFALAHVVMWGLMLCTYFQEGFHGFKDNMR